MGVDTRVLCPSCGKPLPANAPKGLCQACLLKAGFPTGTETDGSEACFSRSAFVPPTPEEVAAQFPQLEILELIGRGGMGAVYKARQKQLRRIAALKILPPGVGDQPAFAERFTREARALAALNHPGIVTLYEFGQTNGLGLPAEKGDTDQPKAARKPSPEHHETKQALGGCEENTGLFFFLMEFVDGMNLRQLLNVGRIAPREALAIVPQICDALQYAHDQGVVHRDIKPENILLDRRGRVKVADFGLARLMESEAAAPALSHSMVEGATASGALTDTGKVMGTPQYMAPEQKERPTEVDHRADIYALGVVLYQMLTGELPGSSIEPPSKKIRLDVRLDQVVLRALEKEPARRYQDASQFKTQVETIATDMTDSSAPIKTASMKARFGVKGVVAGAAALALIALAVLFAGRASQKSANSVQIISLNNTQPNDLIEYLRPTLPKTVTATPDSRTRQILLHGPEPAVHDAAELIERADRSALQASKGAGPVPDPVRSAKGVTAEDIRNTSVTEWFELMGRPKEQPLGHFAAMNALIAKARQSDDIRDDIILTATKIIDEPIEDDFRRWQCCYVLSGIQDKRGIPPVIRALHDKNPVVRGVAAWALGAFENAEARAALRDAAANEKDPSVLEWIRKALARNFGNGTETINTNNINRKGL